jgi:hypothetical protein
MLDLLLNKIDGLMRTSWNADTVHITFINIDDGNSIDNPDRIHRTGFDALTGSAAFSFVYQKLHDTL